MTTKMLANRIAIITLLLGNASAFRPIHKLLGEIVEHNDAGSVSNRRRLDDQPTEPDVVPPIDVGDGVHVDVNSMTMEVFTSLTSTIAEASRLLSAKDQDAAFAKGDLKLPKSITVTTNYRPNSSVAAYELHPELAGLWNLVRLDVNTIDTNILGGHFLRPGWKKYHATDGSFDDFYYFSDPSTVFETRKALGIKEFNAKQRRDAHAVKKDPSKEVTGPEWELIEANKKPCWSSTPPPDMDAKKKYVKENPVYYLKADGKYHMSAEESGAWNIFETRVVRKRDVTCPPLPPTSAPSKGVRQTYYVWSHMLLEKPGPGEIYKKVVKRSRFFPPSEFVWKPWQAPDYYSGDPKQCPIHITFNY